MKTTTLGPSGIRCSAIGLGTWAMGGWMWGGGDNAGATLAIQASLDAGVTLIDTAPAYGLGRPSGWWAAHSRAGATRP